MCAHNILFVFSLFGITGYADSVATFDQRQTGDLNVQVDLKDLRIIAMIKGGKEEYVDYDYAYDYSEMTIKPQNGTTPKPVNGTTTATDTVRDNATASSALSVEQTTLPVKNNNSQSFEAVTEATVNDPATTVKSYDVTKDPTNVNLTQPSNSTNCKKGFSMNQAGGCELKLPSTSTGNALLKLVKLSQKLKLRREHRTNQDDSV